MGKAPFAQVVELFQFWTEYPPVFMLVRNFFDIKSSNSSGAPVRQGKRGVSSSEEEKAAFVHMWGGSVMHTDSLPLNIQGAIAEALKGLEAERAHNG